MSHLLQEDVRLFTAGVLGGEDLLRVGEHLAECADCRASAQKVVERPAVDVASIEALIAEGESGAFSYQEIVRRLIAAETALAGAIAVAESESLRRLYGRVLFVDSWIQQEHGRLQAARDLNVRARALFESIGDEVQVARTLLGEACLLVQVDPGPHVHELVRVATAIFTRHGDTRRITVAQATVAFAMQEQGRFREAAAIFRELIENIADDHPDRPFWLHNLAYCLMRCGDTQTAEQLEIEALAIPAFAAVNTSIRARWSLALALANRGEFDEAIERINALIDEATTRGLQYDAMSMACNVADLLCLMNRHEEACAVLQPVIRYVADEDLPIMAKMALALFRDAVAHQLPNMLEELDKFRNEFPHLLAPPPRPITAVARQRGDRSDA